MKNNSLRAEFRIKIRMMTIAVILMITAAAQAGQRVELPAGSIDGLAAAIASAGTDGTVIVKTGIHTESSTVSITSPVRILGEPGAVLECGTTPITSTPIPVIATLAIQHTETVVVQGVQFRPLGVAANCAVLIENSSHVRVLDNSISGFEFGVVLQYGDQASIRGNAITGNPSYGILVINGASAEISGNTISGAGFGIFASDRDGLALKNSLSSCYVGMILCHLPPATVNVSGDVSGAQTRCTNWQVEGNLATGNSWGYEVIDGSHGNFLVNNAASNNSEYDLELAGDTSRYGFFAPASYENVVVAGSQKGLIVKDCGNNDVIRGVVNLVDHNLDPCD